MSFTLRSRSWGVGSWNFAGPKSPSNQDDISQQPNEKMKIWGFPGTIPQKITNDQEKSLEQVNDLGVSVDFRTPPYDYWDIRLEISG